MKILVFSGGLGNQIFGYAFSIYLRERCPNKSIFGIYNSMWLHEHNGLEINKYFNVQLPRSALRGKAFVVFLFLAKKLGLFSQSVNMDTRTYTPNAIVYSACKMDIEFIPSHSDWIRFKDIQLSDANLYMLERIRKVHSVFIHVRKGDYYNEENIDRLGGTCPVEYYNEAIKHMLYKDKSAVFFVFSDDMSWVRNNLKIPNPNYIDWNKDDKSYIDLFLMTNCKNAIIANSTFSFWGAMLGVKKNIVTYPEKWINPPHTPPDIFPQEWIKI